jgi:hypothetical protein
MRDQKSHSSVHAKVNNFGDSPHIKPLKNGNLTLESTFPVHIEQALEYKPRGPCPLIRDVKCVRLATLPQGFSNSPTIAVDLRFSHRPAQ